MMANKIVEMNVGSEGTLNDDELRKAITILKSIEDAGYERNINNMTQEDDYKSHWKDKDATTFNDAAYIFLNSYEDEISDSSKQVEASKERIKDTHVHYP